MVGCQSDCVAGIGEAFERVDQNRAATVGCEQLRGRDLEFVDLFRLVVRWVVAAAVVSHSGPPCIPAACV